MQSESPLVRGTPADIKAIMAIERRPGFDELVGRWPAERHEAEMAKPGSLYWLLKPGAAAEGFALLQDLDSFHDAAHLKRIAVHTPGRGAGGRLLEAMLEWLFTETRVNRLSLDVFPENERAQAAYLRAGFEIEGLCRDRFRRTEGGYRPALMMGILKRDWLSRHTPSPKK